MKPFRARRVFASTGPRMVLDLRVNGTFLGGETTASGPVRIEARVEGETEKVVRDHRVIHATPQARGEGRESLRLLPANHAKGWDAGLVKPGVGGLALE